MFGDIKLDKLRGIYNKQVLSLNERELVAKKLKKVFPNSKVSNKAGYILNTCTPTKLKRKRKEAEHNLQMPSEAKFKEALEEITLYDSNIASQINTTITHLTKDVILSYPVGDVISMLSQQSYPYLESGLKSSNGEPSLYLHYERSPDSEQSCKFTVKFYNKVQEYYSKHGTYICPLYEPLTEEEKRLVGSSYNKKENTLDLSKLNILRIEIEYVQRGKLIPITKKLNPKAKSLTFEMIIEALNEGRFYKTIEEVFNETLKKHIFIERKTNTAELSGVRGLACKLLSRSPHLLHYEAVLNELGLKNQFSELEKIAREIAPDSELYTELYNALFPAPVNEEESIEEGIQSISSCKTYNSLVFKHFILVYEVYIWDDS